MHFIIVNNIFFDKLSRSKNDPSTMNRFGW